MKKQKITIDISTWAIFKIALALVAGFAVYKIANVLVMIFGASIIAATLHGPIRSLEKKGVPRVVGAILAYIVLFLVLSFVVYLIIPPLVQEVGNLANNFPYYFEKADQVSGFLKDWIDEHQLQDQLQQTLTQISQTLTSYTSGIFSATVSFFGGVASAFVVLIISFYLTVQAKEAKKFLVSLFPPKKRDYASDFINRIQVKLGGWLRGQIILSIIVGSLFFVGLSLLGVKYALILALLAAIFEIIPWLGPILSGTIAVILALFQSPWLALAVLALFWVIQQLENYLLVPQIMKRTVGLNTLVIIIALLMGVRVGGLIGVVLAVPAAAIAVELIRDWQGRRK